jgi:uncharacterized membrane protein YuzA (DUF378 family)
LFLCHKDIDSCPLRRCYNEENKNRKEVEDMRRMSTLEWVAFVLVVLGAVNWGLVGLFGFNLVETIFGTATTLTRLVYVLVGVAGVYELVALAMPSKS